MGQANKVSGSDHHHYILLNLNFLTDDLAFSLVLKLHLNQKDRWDSGKPQTPINSIMTSKLIYYQQIYA